MVSRQKYRLKREVLCVWFFFNFSRFLFFISVYFTNRISFLNDAFDLPDEKNEHWILEENITILVNDTHHSTEQIEKNTERSFIPESLQTEHPDEHLNFGDVASPTSDIPCSENQFCRVDNIVRVKSVTQSSLDDNVTFIQEDILNPDFGSVLPPDSTTIIYAKDFLEVGCSKWKCASSSCYCDENCLLFNDCCVEHFDRIALENVLDALEDPVEYLNKNRVLVHGDFLLLKYYSSCMSINISPGDIYLTFLVVDKCPIEYNGLNFIKTYCEQMKESDIRNVYASKQKRAELVFRNVFCAICHGFHLKDLQLWNMDAACANGVSVSNSSFEDIENHCNFSVQIPHRKYKPRRCFSDYINTREVSKADNKNMSLLCNGYIEAVSYGQVYKNRYCMPFELRINTTKDHCVLYSDRHRLENVINLNLLFAVSNNGVMLNGQNLLFKCSQNMVFDFLSNSCKEVKCPVDFLTKNGGCIPLLHKNGTSIIPFESGIRTNNIFQLEFTVTLQESSLTDDILHLLKNGCPESIVFFLTDNFYPVRNSQNSPFHMTNITIASTQELVFLLSCLELVTKNNSLFKIEVENYEDDTDLSCQDEKILYTMSFLNFSLYDNLIIIFLEDNKTIDLFFTRFSMTFHNGQAQLESLYYCSVPRFDLNCSKLVSYNANEYSYVNNSLLIYDRFISTNDYYIENGTLFMCAIDPAESETKTYTVIEMITYVCSSISILALLVVIWIHIVFPKLLTLHGKNLLAMSLSSLLAQVFLLICHVLPQPVQKFLTPFHHGLWLSLFSWMSIIAFDICRKFSVKTMMQCNAKDNFRFRIYCLVACGLPLIIVAICVFLDYHLNPGIIDYNKDGLCWISSWSARLYAFFIPAVTSVAISFICLVVAVYGIESARRSTGAVIKQTNNRNMCLIYTKLTIILGITWILAFVAANLNELFLIYVNTVLNGLQGFFICVISICNQKTIKEIRRRNKKSSKTTSATKTFSTI